MHNEIFFFQFLLDQIRIRFFRVLDQADFQHNYLAYQTFFQEIMLAKNGSSKTRVIFRSEISPMKSGAFVKLFE